MFAFRNGILACSFLAALGTSSLAQAPNAQAIIQQSCTATEYVYFINGMIGVQNYMLEVLLGRRIMNPAEVVELAKRINSQLSPACQQGVQLAYPQVQNPSC